MIEKLKQYSDHLLSQIDLTFQRDFIDKLTSYKTISLIGERGIGKTYTVLQFLKKSPKKSLYFSADLPIITDIFSTVSDLVTQYGIKLIVIDEIHKALGWQDHLKSIIDTFPDLDLIVLGSSSLDIYHGTAPLARRIHHVPVSPLSFREFLRYFHDIDIPNISFQDLVTRAPEISYELCQHFTHQHIADYMKFGGYPYAKTSPEIFHELLGRNLQKVIQEDLPTFLTLPSDIIIKAEKLFYFIAQTTPSDLNYASLAQKIGCSQGTLENIITYLSRVGVLNLAIRSNKTTDILRKEFKIFLGNPNLYHAFTDTPNIGTLRESFVLSALKRIERGHTFINTDVILPQYGDFLYQHNETSYLFEVGGAKKSPKSIHNAKHGFIVRDNILIAEKNILPLWMFGLL